MNRPRITRDQFNALPENVRRYIMYIETDCDPSGTIRSEMHLRDLVQELEAALIEAMGGVINARAAEIAWERTASMCSLSAYAQQCERCIYRHDCRYRND